MLLIIINIFAVINVKARYYYDYYYYFCITFCYNQSRFLLWLNIYIFFFFLLLLLLQFYWRAISHKLSNIYSSSFSPRLSSSYHSVFGWSAWFPLFLWISVCLSIYPPFYLYTILLSVSVFFFYFLLWVAAINNLSLFFAVCVIPSTLHFPFFAIFHLLFSFSLSHIVALLFALPNVPFIIFHPSVWVIPKSSVCQFQPWYQHFFLHILFICLSSVSSEA